MKKPEITQGEWKYVEIDNDVNGALYSTTMGVFMDGRVVTIGSANNGKYLKKFKANAKAISAVPEMIDALIDELNFLKSIEGFFSKAFEVKINERIKEIEQALKKAGAE